MKEGVAFIKGMSRDAFYHQIVERLGRKRSFGALVSFGAGYLSKEEKEELHRELALVGIESEYLKTDEDLDDVATAIVGRSVTLH